MLQFDKGQCCRVVTLAKEYLENGSDNTSISPHFPLKLKTFLLLTGTYTPESLERSRLCPVDCYILRSIAGKSLAGCRCTHMTDRFAIPHKQVSSLCDIKENEEIIEAPLPQRAICGQTPSYCISSSSQKSLETREPGVRWPCYHCQADVITSQHGERW